MMGPSNFAQPSLAQDMEKQTKRELAAILMADVVEYGRLIGCSRANTICAVSGLLRFASDRIWNPRDLALVWRGSS